MNMRRYIALVEGAYEPDSLLTDEQRSRLPPTVVAKAMELYDAVNHHPERIGHATVVDGFWIETHTLGCRDAADVVGEENQWEDHYEIYDEYIHDGVSIVAGEPESGVFVTITPQRPS